MQTCRDRPGGRVRISAHSTAALFVIAPKLHGLRMNYPDVIVELAVEDGLTDIVLAGFDAGVRSGELVAKDMISIRIGPEQRPAVVATPGYFESHPVPLSPKDLERHDCIAYRLVTSGGSIVGSSRKRVDRSMLRLSQASSPTMPACWSARPWTALDLLMF